MKCWDVGPLLAQVVLFLLALVLRISSTGTRSALAGQNKKGKRKHKCGVIKGWYYECVVIEGWYRDHRRCNRRHNLRHPHLMAIACSCENLNFAAD